MISKIVTDKDGNPVDGNGTKLSPSTYQPSEAVKKLFAQCQVDYETAWRLQHRPFDEFDGISLLERTKKDQETFGAYVGMHAEPEHKKWKWKGRKNTARNKIIGILAHMLAGMLYPFCYAYNEENEEDKMTAKVMRIQIENHLKKAGYEIKFLFIITSALVSPAMHLEVEYIEALQRIKIKNDDGTYNIEEAVDELLSGVNMNILPVDQILPFDFFTFDVQRQPGYAKVRRISWDEARKIYQGKYKMINNGVETDPFDFVKAGQTRTVLAGQENQTLYDIEWTEADANYVQEVTFYYRPEDLEVTWLGGTYMGDDLPDVSPYNANPFKHRRMVKLGDSWKSIPVYPWAKTGFEPLDPNGRFYYYKSAAFKEFWDDASQNRMHQLAFDGTSLDVIKPMFLSGMTKADQTVMVPGATIGMPTGASVTPYQLGPNLVAALNMMRKQEDDMSESTQDKNQSGIAEKGVTAYAVNKAEQNAKVILGVFGVMIANLITDVGMLVMDDIIMHTTVGDIDDTVPEALNMKFKTMMLQGKEGGKDITNKIQFSTNLMGDNITPEKADELEWDLFNKAGGIDTTDRVYIVNPYKFARHKFSLFIDPDMIVSRSMGTDQLRKDRAFNMMMDPRVLPYIDPEAVVDTFILEEFSEGDPDKFKRKQGQPVLNPDGTQQNTGGEVVPPQNNNNIQIQ